MLKYVNYSIVFAEVPDELTLAINLSNCPNRCKGCHSPHLMDDIGQPLDKAALLALLQKYHGAISCVALMGGDAAPAYVEQLARWIWEHSQHKVKVAWYSGKAHFAPECSLQHFHYVKLGPYIESLGGLDSPTSNQRLYKVKGGVMEDITWRMRKHQ